MHSVAMKISDYVFGRRLGIRSTLLKEEFEVRVNQAAGSNLWPFREGVVGGVHFGRLRLRYQGFPLFDYNAKPRLSGNINNEHGVTTAELSYRAPTWVLAFFSFWYLFLTAISLFAVVTYVGDAPA